LGTQALGLFTQKLASGMWALLNLLFSMERIWVYYKVYKIMKMNNKRNNEGFGGFGSAKTRARKFMAKLTQPKLHNANFALLLVFFYFYLISLQCTCLLCLLAR